MEVGDFIYYEDNSYIAFCKEIESNIDKYVYVKGLQISDIFSKKLNTINDINNTYRFFVFHEIDNNKFGVITNFEIKNSNDIALRPQLCTNLSIDNQIIVLKIVKDLMKRIEEDVKTK